MAYTLKFWFWFEAHSSWHRWRVFFQDLKRTTRCRWTSRMNMLPSLISSIKLQPFCSEFWYMDFGAKTRINWNSGMARKFPSELEEYSKYYWDKPRGDVKFFPDVQYIMKNHPAELPHLQINFKGFGSGIMRHSVQNVPFITASALRCLVLFS